MINIISYILITSGVILLIYNYFIMPKNKNYPHKKNIGDKYCILIPARDESNVIERLLISIEKQTRKINSHDVYIIVENKNDKTVEIVNNHNMNIVFRKDLSKEAKGYALNDAVKEILNKNIHYDAYFIFDADNILDKNFIKEMEKTINEGYDTAIGYRNTENSNTLISAASSLTFSMINTLFNSRKNKYTNNLTISGTGYYISGYLLEKWQGFPFHELTEDYELTLYSTLNDLTCFYNKKAIFYDEQPNNLKKSIIQRTRWVKGYLDSRKKFVKKIKQSITKNDKNFASKTNEVIGIKPYLLIIFGLILFIINSSSINIFLLKLIIALLIIYIILLIFTYIMIKKEKNLNMTNKMKIKVLFYNPIFLASYLWCLIKALTTKNLKWKKIKHGD